MRLAISLIIAFILVTIYSISSPIVADVIAGFAIGWMSFSLSEFADDGFKNDYERRYRNVL